MLMYEVIHTACPTNDTKFHDTDFLTRSGLKTYRWELLPPRFKKIEDLNVFKEHLTEFNLTYSSCRMTSDDKKKRMFSVMEGWETTALRHVPAKSASRAQTGDLLSDNFSDLQ